jgi:hypothetical protein
LGVWQHARTLAVLFWETVAADERIGAEFREVARVNCRQVQAL